jgi:hypothetical protein
VAHHVEELLVRPDVVLERRHVEVADQDRRAADAAPAPGSQIRQEIELVREFRVAVAVGHVAAGRDVKIVQHDPGGLAGLRPQHRRDVARVLALAERHHVPPEERKARQDGDAVIALLPREHDVLVARAPQGLQRKRVVRALRLLQAKHVRLGLGEEAQDRIDAQAHRVDVPGGDGEAHGVRLA